MQQLQFPQWVTCAAALALLSVPLRAETHYEQSSPGSIFRPQTTPTDHHVDLQVPAGTVSVELLRYPLPDKARRMLLKAERVIDSGDHKQAVDLLEKVMAKFPASAPYTQSLLGVEYLRIDRFSEASKSLQRAVDLLPHDAVNHYNLGLSFVFTHQEVLARQELHRALELDPQLAPAVRLLAALPDKQSR